MVKTEGECLCIACMGSLTFPKKNSLKFKTYLRRILGSFRHIISNSMHFFDMATIAPCTTIAHLLGIQALKVSSCKGTV